MLPPCTSPFCLRSVDSDRRSFLSNYESTLAGELWRLIVRFYLFTCYSYLYLALNTADLHQTLSGRSWHKSSLSDNCCDIDVESRTLRTTTNRPQGLCSYI